MAPGSRPLQRIVSAACVQAVYSSLIGAGEQCPRYDEIRRLGGLQVDEKLNFGCLLDRKLGGLVALENSAGIIAAD
jgi:hypothetical protein